MIAKLLVVPALIILGIGLVPLHTRAEPVFHIVINEVQTGGVGSGTTSQEFIELYNATDSDVDLSGWKVEYITSTGGTTKNLVILKDTIESHGLALLVTSEFGNPGDFTFTAGLSGSAGHVRLRDANNTIVDTVGWGTSATLAETKPAGAPLGGHSITRKISNGLPVDTDNNANDFEGLLNPTPQGGSVYEPSPDLCPNLVDRQTVIPEGYTINEVGNCIVTPITPPPDLSNCDAMELSEILANPAGDDTGKEFIEIHNSSNQQKSLAGCTLKVGSKTYALPADQLSANGYRAFYSAQTGLQLTNTGGEVVLMTPTTETAVDYSSLGDGQVWTIINNSWQLSNAPTPNAPNVLSSEEGATSTGTEQSSTLAPCPAGKFRNPQTNRCKSIAPAQSLLLPCKSGQERNPDTNRCRNITLATALLTPCKEGYERNPDTNRCRKTQGADSPTACRDGQERNPDTNRCRKIVSTGTGVLGSSKKAAPRSSTNTKVLLTIGFLIFGYGIYEYRTDLKNLVVKFRGRNKGGSSSQ